jgi:hypothetical protein
MKSARTEKKMMSIRLDVELQEGLRKVCERDGIPVTEQLRRAVRAWLKEKRVMSPKGEKS